jgi:glycosyltransferase involved in cell wall biosynthesis
MSKFSVVIPTLFRSPRLKDLLTKLNECESVDEILLIDNARKYDEYLEKMSKVRVLTPHFNIYVNQAWNYGVQYSKNNSIALVNDDITFDTRIFERFDETELKSKGFIGMSSENYKEGVEYNPQLEPWKGEVVLHGWGCIIMFHKDHWKPIPEELKIWYGDNYMREINPAPSHILKGLPIQTEMSTTSKDSQWNPIKQSEAQYWIDNFKVKAHERIKETLTRFGNL